MIKGIKESESRPHEEEEKEAESEVKEGKYMPEKRWSWEIEEDRHALSDLCKIFSHPDRARLLLEPYFMDGTVHLTSLREKPYAVHELKVELEKKAAELSNDPNAGRISIKILEDLLKGEYTELTEDGPMHHRAWRQEGAAADMQQDFHREGRVAQRKTMAASIEKSESDKPHVDVDDKTPDGETENKRRKLE